jgi:two-component system, cell cycle sensor histidine kinase and response regulator CckA
MSGVSLGAAQGLFFDLNAEPCWIIEVGPDHSLTMTSVNAAHARRTGINPADVLGRSPIGSLPDEIKKLAEKRLLDVVIAGTPQEFVEELRFPTGALIWKTRLVPVRDGGGAVRWLLGFASDVTEVSHATAALERSERRHRALLESLHDGVWQVDATGCTIFVNPRMAEILGYSVDEMVGRQLFSFCDDAWIEVAKPHLMRRKAGLKETYELSFRAKDGRPVHTLLSVAPQFDDKGDYAGALAGVQDITERLRAEEERATLERKLLETQKLESLGVLAGGIAHDFNNILTGILGSTSLARMDVAATSPAYEHIVQIESASRRAADLCRQMLAYAGKGRFVVQTLDLSQLVRETTQLLDLSISKKASVRYDLASGLPLIAADATQIRQVLMNLVLNASEALGDRPGSITLATGTQAIDAEYLRTSAIEGDLAAGTYAFLEVHDSGCGMSDETIARIFDPFFTTKFTGRGLGLSAVLGIVRGHKGAIKVYSEVGRGTTFKLFFPTAAAASSSIAPEAAADEWRGHGTVLVIDDEPTVCAVTQRILRVLGFEAIVSADGRQGLDIVRQRGDTLAAVLLDLTMPNMDGETAFREMRAVCPQLPIVLMSGYNEQDAVARFAGKGLAGFLQKPFTISAMRDGLREVLRARGES